MRSLPLDPDVADIAPTERALTPYDQEHAITYMRMLDADAEGADWREVSRIVLHIDPDHDVQRARRAFDSHLARAKWMSREGYKHLLRYPFGSPFGLAYVSGAKAGADFEIFGVKAAAAAEVHRAACDPQGTRRDAAPRFAGRSSFYSAPFP
jgi:hypothetical protein